MNSLESALFLSLVPSSNFYHGLNLLSEKYNGFRRRIKLYSLGIFYVKSSKIKIPASLLINGRLKKIKFLDRNDHNFSYEFHEICVNDCYHLTGLRKKLKTVDTIVDIGANQSLFTIAARRKFPRSHIFNYEPNYRLEPVLTYNSKQLNATVYYEAVTKEDCVVSLSYGESDLNTRVIASKEGNIAGTSLRKVIERAGGSIDLLKMDCEGAEWDLFEDHASWKNIKAVTMEYHLWAKNGSTINDIKLLLKKLNFTILFHDISTEKFGIVTAINNEIKDGL